jgi:hypothetical protein
MNSHLSDELLIGYCHSTLTDAEREVMDSHFLRCPECRARLADHEALQRRIRHSLLADLKAAQPSARFGFSAVAPSLRPQNNLAALWRQSSRLVRGATAVVALAGLVVAAISLFGGVGRLAAGVTGVPATPLPVAACFLFAIPVANNCRESRVVPSRLILSYVLAFVLWLGTAILGIYEIYLVREMIFAIYARLIEGAGSGTDYWAALALGNAALIPLSIGWIALVMGGGEYHFKHVGQRCSWKLFGWTIAGELFILLLPWVL